MKEIVLVGGGGHARACAEVIQAEGRFELVGIIERKGPQGKEVFGIPVIGTDQDLPSLAKKGKSFLVAVGQIKTPENRMRLFARLRELKADLPAILAPTSYVSPHAAIGTGTIVMHMAVVGPGALIGAGCILNTRCLVEHDASVGDYCHISTGALVNGGCVVEQGTFVGSGAVLREGIRIGERAVVGMGAVVHRDVAAREVFQ